MKTAPTDAFVVIAEFRVKPDRVDEFLAAAFDDASHSVADEPGCYAFDVHQDSADPQTVLFYEVYGSRSDFDTHLRTGHLARFRERFPPLVVEQKPVRFLVRLSSPVGSQP